MGISLWDLFMRPNGVHLLCLSLRKPYGGLRLLLEFPFVVWTAASGEILTCDSLIKRGYAMLSWCCMCQCNWETVVHLLMHCSVAFDLWSYVFQMFGIQWVLLEKVLDSLCGWQIRGSNLLSAVWNLIPLCVLWPMDYPEGTKSMYFEDVEWTSLHINSIASIFH